MVDIIAPVAVVCSCSTSSIVARYCSHHHKHHHASWAKEPRLVRAAKTVALTVSVGLNYYYGIVSMRVSVGSATFIEMSPCLWTYILSWRFVMSGGALPNNHHTFCVSPGSVVGGRGIWVTHSLAVWNLMGVHKWNYPHNGQIFSYHKR